MSTTELMPSTGDSQPGIRGLVGLAYLPELDFKRQVEMMQKALSRIEEIKQAVLVEGVDYDVIPGTNKPTLLQPGAQKLCLIARFAPSFEITRTVGDGVEVPSVHYMALCRLHLNDTAGPVIAEGIGSASTWERKYRYRRGQRTCPACNSDKAFIKGKAEYGGGWLCFARKGGCGAKFLDDDPKVIGQQVGDVENEDPVDLDNTVLKIAKKRALIDTTLFATASSGTFTTDIEDEEDAKRAGITSDEDKTEARERIAKREEFGKIMKAAGSTKIKDMLSAASAGLGREIKSWQEFERLSLDETVKLVDYAKEKFKPVTQ